MVERIPVQKPMPELRPTVERSCHRMAELMLMLTPMPHRTSRRTSHHLMPERMFLRFLMPVRTTRLPLTPHRIYPLMPARTIRLFLTQERIPVPRPTPPLTTRPPPMLALKLQMLPRPIPL